MRNSSFTEGGLAPPAPEEDPNNPKTHPNVGEGSPLPPQKMTQTAQTNPNGGENLDAIKYFSQPGFKRLFQQMAQRYRGLGRIGGNVVLNNLSPQEQDAIGGVLGKDLTGKSTITVGLHQFHQALEQTRYAGTDFVTLVTAILGQEVISKTEEQLAFQKAKEQFYEGLLSGHPHQLCQDWIRHIEASGPGTRAITQAYTADPKTLIKQLSQVLIALAKLPVIKNSYRRLPMWAAEITGDPHGFDPDTNCGKYLISALQFARNQQEGTGFLTSPTGEQVWDLLDHFGIIRDDLLNFVTCFGLLTDNPFWQQAYNSGTVLNVPVRELAKLDQISVAQGSNVFIIENSGVFSHLADENIVAPMVCTHGQFRLATYMLLDKLASSSIQFWYSGDFDPEGLLMAQRLWDRYPGQVKLWRYSPEDYKNCISGRAIPSKRLKQLDRIHIPELILTADAIKKAAKAGYQENLAVYMAADMRGI